MSRAHIFQYPESLALKYIHRSTVRIRRTLSGEEEVKRKEEKEEKRGKRRGRGRGREGGAEREKAF